MPHDNDSAFSTESPKVVRQRRREARRAERHDQEWTRADFFHDLGRASRRITEEIEHDPAQAQALDRSMREAREGKVISQEELDAQDDDSE